MLTLIEGGDVYAPNPLGRKSLLLAGPVIASISDLQSGAFSNSPMPVETVDASDCFVVPGLIDPHTHLLGGSGEDGFSTQTPEIFASELVQAGITSVVGTLGVDTTTRTMPALLGKAKSLREEGLSAWVWTGGYDVPPKTITGSVRDDITLIEEVIGVGEVAISDVRAMQPSACDLARLATEAHNGGLFTRKAGVLHLHVGDGERKLAVVREMLESFDVRPETLYLTHVERNPELLAEAIELAARGVRIDLDVVEKDLCSWLPQLVKLGEHWRNVTISSDASITSPSNVLLQLVSAVREGHLALDHALRLATANPATILKLHDRGELREGARADVLVLRKDSYEVVHVIAGGKFFVRHGRRAFTERFLEKSDRMINLRGGKREGRND